MRQIDDGLRDSLMPVYPGSTVLKSCEQIKRLLHSVENKSLIRIILGWIRSARFAPKSTILAPKLYKGKTRTYETLLNRKIRSIYSDTTNMTEVAEAERIRINNNESQRASSYEELEELYASLMLNKTKTVERLTEVDWPEGLTYSMISSLLFEIVRNNLTSCPWTACCLDYGDDEETENLLGKKDAKLSRNRQYQTITPIQLMENISAELRNYVSHSIFLNPSEKSVELNSNTNDISVTASGEDWTRSFTHLRIHLCATPKQICSMGLHILHIPKTPWFLVSSGYMGGTEKKVAIKEFIYTAIAHSLGARRVRHSESARSSSKINSNPGSDHINWTSGRLSELRSRDPVALREIILSEFHVVDGDTMAGRMRGGKGRLMDRNEAEDGPLVRAEKRKRVDANGLYEEIAEKEKDRFGDMDRLKDLTSEEFLRTRHPKVENSLKRSIKLEKKKRERELNDLFGLQSGRLDQQGNKANADVPLPRVEQIRYELCLPMPIMEGYGEVPKEIIKAHPIQLRLNGTNVLAGLRNLIKHGLDGEKFKPKGQSRTINASQSRTSDDQQPSGGLPQWLVDVRGTRVRVGFDEDEGEDEGLETLTSNGGD